MFVVLLRTRMTELATMLLLGYAVVGVCERLWPLRTVDRRQRRADLPLHLVGIATWTFGNMLVMWQHPWLYRGLVAGYRAHAPGFLAFVHRQPSWARLVVHG